MSTWYKHINANDIGVPYGSTPYHPDRRNRSGPRPHPAKTVPGRLQIEDRPAGSENRSRFGHYEMDTVVSSTNGTGDHGHGDLVYERSPPPSADTEGGGAAFKLNHHAGMRCNDVFMQALSIL